jgi:hypothetical protein
MDAPGADTIRDSNRPFVLEDWQSILANQGGN